MRPSLTTREAQAGCINEIKVGFILPARPRKAPYREVLRMKQGPLLAICGNSARVGDVSFVLPVRREKSILSGSRRLLEASSYPCVFPASHFRYGTGTRILTLPHRRP
jgi:hypothetical protein